MNSIVSACVAISQSMVIAGAFEPVLAVIAIFIHWSSNRNDFDWSKGEAGTKKETADSFRSAVLISSSGLANDYGFASRKNRFPPVIA